MRKYLLLSLILIAPLSAFGDAFVPEFSSMKRLRCDFEETVYNSDGGVVSTSRLFRNFRLDDENKKIYLEKEPIDRIDYYEADRIEFRLQSMTDEMIIMSRTVIDRNSLEYNSVSDITFDNPDFGTRSSKSVGVCKFID